MTRHLLGCRFRPGLAFDPRCPRCREQWAEKSALYGFTTEIETVRALVQIMGRTGIWDMLQPEERERARKALQLLKAAGGAG